MASCHNLTEHNHILRKYRGSTQFKPKDHTTVTCVNVRTILYSYVLSDRKSLLIIQRETKILKLQFVRI